MADALASHAAAASSARPRMRAWQQAALSLYWFATNAHWTAILITLLPLQAELFKKLRNQIGKAQREALIHRQDAEYSLASARFLRPA